MLYTNTGGCIYVTCIGKKKKKKTSPLIIRINYIRTVLYMIELKRM